MSIKPKAPRLDQALVERGLVESREKAQRAIMAGQVYIGGQRCDKASSPCPADAQVEVRGADRYVSRGGHKLEGALTAFKIDPTGWRCLDVGSSTGGFTDCLLQHGAKRVVCVDVGKGQLHWKLREDPRVELHEGVNAREIASLHLDPVRLVVGDVSFISLRLVLPAAFALLPPDGPGDVVALIKPQFEAGREQVGKGGIVREESVRRGVINSLAAWLHETHPRLRDAGVIPSSITGRDGNQEYLWWIQQR